MSVEKRLVIVLFSCFCHHLCCAQSLSRSVTGAAGDTFQSPKGSLDWTLGELVTETYTQTDKIVTQGFQQPEIKTIDPRQSIVVYPNPVSDSLHIKINSKSTYRVEIYNMLGSKLRDQSFNLNLNKVTVQIDFRDFGPALYILRVSNLKTREVFSFKIEKI